MDVRREAAEQIIVSLSYDEAVVLFELLGRWEWSGALDEAEVWDDQAEQRVIWDLHASMRPIVTKAFSDGYGEAVKAARERLRAIED